MRRTIHTICIFCLILAMLMVGSLGAAITADQKKELKEIGIEIGKISSLVSKKKFDDAGAAIQSAEERLAKFIKDAELKETDPVLKSVQLQLEKGRALLGKANGKGTTNFAKNVAPILVSKCVSCHGEDGRGGLSLETFAGLEKGGSSGGVVIPGNAEGSLLIQRLVTTNDQQRMPKGKEGLTQKEILQIGTWIAEGAKFEGDKSSSLADLSKAAASGKPTPPPRKVVIAKETGKETVHFMKDLMPELVDTCGRCHNDNVKRSGFSVMSFEKVMKGGETGVVVVGGSLENSRLWRLVNGDELPVMPAGNQTGITRKWYNNLRTWILEGATFDGDDAKKNFPSLAEREAVALSRFTPEEWLDRRKKASAGDWKKTFATTEPNHRESAEFLLYGDVSNERLEQVEKWAIDQAASLKQTFKNKDETIWKGKLAIFIFKERFGYEEFNTSVHRREVPPEVIGHSQVNSTMEEALIALQDVGDTVTETSPGMYVNVIEHVTGAFLKRGSKGLPDWIVRGTGLALAHRKSAGNVYLSRLPRVASAILQESNLTEPEKVFVNGTFAPGEVGPIGFTIVEFLMKRGDVHSFVKLVSELQSGSTPEAAIRTVYGAEGKNLALSYAQSLPSSLRKGKK
jgi:cytochrome c553